MLTELLERFRWLELFIRKVYYGNGNIHQLMKKVYSKRESAEKGVGEEFEASWERVSGYIESLGIRNGDILIVHSSADGIRKLNTPILEIIKYLQQLVGDDGTLVLPAYPQLSQTDEAGNLMYDVKRSPCTTGLLPQLFCKTKGTRRSSCPLDSLAANGKSAEEMMKDNLETDLAFGTGSAWDYCVKHNAKILFLGVPVYHSNTVTHYVEDYLDKDWPVYDWYETKTYSIKSNNKTVIKSFRSRKIEWAQYTTQHWNTHLYRNNGLISETVIDGVNIGFNPDAQRLTEFLIKRARYGKLPFVVPKAFRR